MGIIELILLSIGLGMDAFAVSVCKGISMKKMNWKKACIIGLYFGGFQAIMPVIGYFFGSSFESIITLDCFYFIGNNRSKNDTRSISKRRRGI